MKELTWFTKGLRRKMFCLMNSLLKFAKELTWFTKGLRQGGQHNILPVWAYPDGEGTDLIYEGITTGGAILCYFVPL
jgi:hypothetical protein